MDASVRREIERLAGVKDMSRWSPALWTYFSDMRQTADDLLELVAENRRLRAALAAVCPHCASGNVAKRAGSLWIHALPGKHVVCNLNGQAAALGLAQTGESHNATDKA